MNAKCVCCLTMALLSVGCSRQHSQSTASGAGTVQATATTVPPAGNPEPVAPPVPPVEATLPPRPSPEASRVAAENAVGKAAQAPTLAQPIAPKAVPGKAGADPRSSPFQAREPRTTDVRPAMLTIPASTRFRVRLAETLNTKYSHDGQRFFAYLDEPIVSGDRVVVPKGTTFEGHVVEAKRSGRLRGRAYLGITLDSFRLHGARYTVATAPDFRSSGSHKKRNIAFIGGGSGGGAMIGAVAGGGVGAAIGAGAGAVAGTTTAIITGKKDVRLPVETPLVFSLRTSVAVHG
jgi:hypothetical protein